MICVKCGGQSVFPAMNEAPDGARDWRKCLSCGKRWNPLTDEDLSTIKRAFEEWQPGDDERESGGEGAFDAEDRRIALEHADAFDDLDPLDEPAASPTDLAMNDVLVKRGRKKKEKEPMPKFVSEAHRQRWIAGQKLSRQLKREAAGGGATHRGHAEARPPEEATRGGCECVGRRQGAAVSGCGRGWVDRWCLRVRSSGRADERAGCLARLSAGRRARARTHTRDPHEGKMTQNNSRVLP